MDMATWPDLAAIEALVAVADHGSLAAAARSTGMAQPNVSRSIARLERRFGLSLIHRSTTGATLTPQGLVVVEWSRELLDAARRLADGVIALGDGPGSLTVAASQTVAENLVPGWIGALRRARPDLRIRTEVCNSAEVVGALQAGRCDVGFIEGPDTPRGLNHRVVGRDELVLVAPPGSSADPPGRAVAARRTGRLAVGHPGGRVRHPGRARSRTAATWVAADPAGPGGGQQCHGAGRRGQRSRPGGAVGPGGRRRWSTPAR